VTGGGPLRTRLTLLYAGGFFLCGGALLALTFGTWQHRTSVAVSRATPGPSLQGPTVAIVQHGADRHQLVLASLLGLALMAVAAVVVGWLISGRVLQPLRTITATARHISANNLHQRLDLSGRDDELHELGATLDDLFGRLESSFESQRHFVANASHELRTPLTVERTLLQVALADPEATIEDLRSTCERVLTIGRDQEELIDSLLTLASGERGLERRLRIDLEAVAGKVLAARSGEASARGVEVVAHLSPAAVVGDPSLVDSMIGNLVDNAVRHNVPGGRVDVSTSGATVRIANTGPMVPEGEVGRLFEPFQRLGDERVRRDGGHGLGLAIVRAIATAHGAAVQAAPRPGGGLEVTVTFPAM
jgi:signal transduction histidine kinase